MKLSLMTFMIESSMLMEGEWILEKTARMESVLQDARKAGFTCVDLTVDMVIMIGPDKVKTLLDQLGLSVGSLICSGFMADQTISDEKAEKKYTEALDLAQTLAADHLMLVPGFFVPSQKGESVRETLARRMGHIVSSAGPKGILCMIEDDPNLVLEMNTSEQVSYYLKQVPGLKVVFDTANVLVGGQTPEAFFSELEEYTIHVHIKDIAPCEDESKYRDKGIDGTYFCGMPHGTGIIDFDKIFSCFQQHGFEGILALEYIPQEGIGFEEDFKRVYQMFEKYDEQLQTS